MRQITKVVDNEEELNFAIRPFVAKRLPYLVKRVGGGFALFDQNAKERTK